MYESGNGRIHTGWSPSNKLPLSLQLRLADNFIYCIPINDTTLELFAFWPSDTESRINELRFSESISLSFKARLTSATASRVIRRYDLHSS